MRPSGLTLAAFPGSSSLCEMLVYVFLKPQRPGLSPDQVTRLAVSGEQVRGPPVPGCGPGRGSSKQNLGLKGSGADSSPAPTPRRARSPQN